MIEKILTALIGAIRKIWNLFSCLLLLATITAVALFVITIFAPAQVLNAVEIVRGFFV